MPTAGGEAAAQTGQQVATEGFKTIGEQAITSGLENLPVGSGGVGIPTESGMYFPGATPGAGVEIGSAAAPSAAGTNYYGQAAQNYLNPQNFSKLAPETLQQYQSALNAPGVNPQDVVSAAGRAQGAAGATTTGNVMAGLKQATSSPSAAGSFVKDNALTLGSALLPSMIEDQKPPAGYTEDEYDRYLKGFRMSPNYQAYEAPRPNPYYQAKYAAQGGIMQLQGGGGPVERMSMANTAMNPQGGLYPQGMIDKTQYATPTQRPVSAEMVDAAPAYERSNPMLMNTGGPTRLPKGDPGIYKDANPTTRGQDAYTASLTNLNSLLKRANIKGLPALKAAAAPLSDIQEAAKGGVMSGLGGYSDGGRMLKGPGDGMSDSIPGVIGRKQPARLADGEFVVPADVVSHIGNGSSKAGAKKLYAMMDKIRKARTGRTRQAPEVNARRYMPA